MAGKKKKSVATAYVQVVPTVQGIKGILGQAFGAEGASAGSDFGGKLIDAVKDQIAEADLGKQLSESMLDGIDLEGADLKESLGDIEAMFEDSADAIADDAEDTSKKILTFGDMLKAGLASGVLLETAKEIGGAIVDIGRDAVEAAAEVRAANAQFEQTFGALEGTARNALESISDATGIASTRLQGAYTSLYAFTKSVGGDSATALNIAQRAMNAAADSAAYYDRTVEDATETLQSFLKGNYENDAALGIAATETTRNAMANKLYAKSFQELSEAQKVDTLLAMVEAGNRASGAMGQAAREADSWANVTGELAEAWRQFLAVIGSPVMDGLIPMIQGITDGLKSMTEQTSFEVLNLEIGDFQASLTAAEQSLADSTAQMYANSSMAQQYVDRLQALESAGLSTAEAQREYAQVVELLNNLMPELNLTIDSTTGRLTQNTDAIRDNIRSLRDQAEHQAKQAYYKSIIDSYAEAYEAQYSAQMELMKLQEEEKRLTAQLTVANQEYAATLGYNTQQQEKERQYLDQIKNELAANARAQESLTESIHASTEALATEEAKLTAAQTGFEGLTAAEQEAADAASEQAAAQAELQAAYAQTVTAARESIDSQIGLFEELADESDWSAARIVENWEKQQKAFADYSINLQKAVDMGLDEALVQQLADGSQQSMQILDALVNDTGISIDEINAQFRGLDDARDEVAGVMGEISAITAEAMDGIVRAAQEGGRNTAAGIAKGIRENFTSVENAMRDMGKRAQVAYNHTLDIHSPSRVMEESGEWTALGGVKGVKNMIPAMEQTMAELGSRGVAAYNRNLSVEAALHPPQIANAAAYTDSTVNNNSTVSYGGISINIYTQPGQDPHSITDAVLEELTHRIGQEEAAFGR